MMGILEYNTLENLQKTKELLTEQWNEGLNSSVSETVTKAQNSLSETLYRGKAVLDAATSQGVHQVSTLTEKAKAAINQTTSQGVQTVQQTTYEGIGQIQQTTETLKVSLVDKLMQADSFRQGIVDNIQDAVSTAFQNWLNAHPPLPWLVSHPWLSLLAFLTLIVIFFNLIQLANSLIKKSLVWLLASPFKLLISAFGFGSQSVFKIGGSALNQMASANNLPALGNGKAVPSNLNTQQRISEILTRLEELKHEQDQLLQEISKIVGKD